jgi:hypothetical protein
MKPTFLLHGLAALTVLALAGSAAAGPAESAAVVVDPESTDALMSELVRGRAEVRLRDLGFGVVTTLDADKAAAVAHCLRAGKEAPACDETAALGLSRLLLVRAETSTDPQGEPLTTLYAWLLDGKSGQAIVSEQSYCERCSVDTVALSADELVTRAVRAAGARTGSTLLSIRSTPTGARVSVDGVAVGVTDLEYGTYPGAHKIEISKPGYQRLARTVNATTLAKTDVFLALEPLAPKEKRTRWGTWSLLAASGALVATGSILVAMHSPPVEDGVRQPTERNTLWPGIATLGIGVALGVVTVVGVY